METNRIGKISGQGFAWILCLMFVLGSVAFGQTAAEIIQSADWTERQVGEGVITRSHQFSNLFGGGQRIFYAEADMSNPDVSLRFVSVGGTTRRRVSQWASETPGASAVINGAWFDVSLGPIQFLKINGNVIANTHPNAQERGGIVINAQGAVTCRTRPGAGWPSLSEPNVMASEVPLVVDGQPFQWTPPEAPDYNYYYVNRHPRSAIGVTADNRVLLVVADGRDSPHAIGLRYSQMAELMIALGAQNATVLDGGGSSTLWARDYGVINTPSDGSERSVASALVLVAPEVALPYHAGFIQAEYVQGMTAGTSQTVSLQFENAGTEPWDQNTFLGTTEPRDRTSAFESPSWLSSVRPARATEGTVAPGQTGTFQFVLTAPNLSETTGFAENFGLVQEMVAWFGPERNTLNITVMPASGQTEIIIESRAGGKNFPWYSEDGGFADSGANCTAPGATPTIGMRYGSTYRSVAGLKIATYRPFIATPGEYSVEAAWGDAGSRRSPIVYRVTSADGVAEYQIDQGATANQWVSLGTHWFDSGTGGSVEVSNEAIDASGNMYAGPVRFTLQTLSRTSEAWRKY